MVKHSVILAAVLAASPATAPACNVPVFRYALERWEPAAFDLIVVHRGALSTSHHDAIEALRQAAGSTGFPVNMVVQVLDSGQSSQPSLAGKLQAQSPPRELPWVYLVHPVERLGPAQRAIAWAGPLDTSLVSSLVDSPVRREIARRLLKGDSAVWILVEGGHADRDSDAAALLEREFLSAQKTITIPEPDNDLTPVVDWRISETVPLRVAFSVLRVARDDPSEAFLLAMLRGGLDKFPDGPVAIAVFGRGRALEVMAQSTLTSQKIAEAMQFVCGPCSCQAKEENPGFDLMIAADWEGLLQGRLVVDKDLPPLRGMATLAHVDRFVEGHDPDNPTPAPSNALGMHILVVVGVAGLAVVLAGVVVLCLRRRRDSLD